jgi:hypothetical protein
MKKWQRIARTALFRPATLLIAAAIHARRSRRKLAAQFDVEILTAPAAAIGTASYATFVAAVTLAVGGGIPCAIVWGVYSMWRAS